MHICHPSYDREHRVRRTMLHACLGNKQTLSLKRVGETEGVCEAVEYQPSKHKSQYILKTKKKKKVIGESGRCRSCVLTLGFQEANSGWMLT
jgi:hypothetical protein